MKRLIVLLALCLTTGFAAAEPLGFGLVNTNQTNFRKAIGGDIAFRLDKGELVYIAEHQADAKGREWYRVTTYAHDQSGKKRGCRRSMSIWARSSFLTLRRSR